jgi:hypothetical protein
MKKNYMTPTVEVIRIEPHQMIASSPGSLTFSNDDVVVNDDGDYED